MPTAEQIIFTQEDWRVLDSLQLRNLSALKGICDEMSKEIIRELTDGINAGEGMPKLSARIQKAVGMGKTRADLMARTETINAAVDGCRVRYEQAGIKEFEYLAASDARTCEQCASHNGKIYKLTDNANLPPLHPNCRCAIAPIVGSRKKEIEQTANTVITQPQTFEPVPQTNYTPIQTLKPGTPENKETKEALEAATDWNSLNKAMESRYGHPIALSITLKQRYRFEDVKESIIAADEICEDMPAIAEQLTSLGDFTGTKAYAKASPDRISFGSLYKKSRSRKELQDALDGDYNHNFHPSREISTIYIHEMGHIAEAALIRKKNNGKLIVSEWTKSTQARILIREAALNVQRKQDPTWKPGEGSEKEINFITPWMIEDISRYAMENYSEALAEAFSDYYSNKEDANDLSKEIIKLLKKELS